ncbi:MFS transporter [Caldicellulosiruptoraceae bacterium PP1]
MLKGKNINNLKINEQFNLLFFIIANALMGIAGGINDSSFNNFLDHTYKISAFMRGSLEFPREMPGFLLIFITGLLFFLGDLKISILATLLCSISMIGIGFFAPSYFFVVIWLVLYNTGTHLNMILTSSIGMNLSKDNSFGKILGKIGSISTAATIIGYLIIFLGFRFFGFTYSLSFLMASIFYFIAVIFLFPIDYKANAKGFKFVIKKEYWLYYVLSIFFGARKQIFITFAPWVLIKIFKQPVSNFAIAGIICSILGVGFRSLLGHLIDKLGEKKILMFEAISIIVICFGYFFTGFIGHKNIALILAYSCYMIDNLLMAASMARSVYIKKRIKNEDDLTPTLATGTSMDHAVSMSLPILGGLIWSIFGYSYVFLLAALLAFINLMFVRKITPV